MKSIYKYKQKYKNSKKLHKNFLKNNPQNYGKNPTPFSW